MVYYRKNDKNIITIKYDNINNINNKIEEIYTKFDDVNNKINKINDLHIIEVKEFHIDEYFKSYDSFKININENLKILQFNLSNKLENVLFDLRLYLKLTTLDDLYRHKFLFVILEIINNDTKFVLYNDKIEFNNEDHLFFSHIYYISNYLSNNIVCNLYLYHDRDLYKNINFKIDKEQSKIQIFKYNHNHKTDN